ncbi:MAG: ATP-binding cassette domain-containing protein [Geobacter sp.]|nr:ATP-binding cassette domain-containing protein [Geobacter sp.]
MIQFANVTAEHLDTPLDFSIPDGVIASLVTSRDVEGETIVRLLLGFRAPISGSISVNGLEPSTLIDSQLSDFRRGIGGVYHDGGFISNLNMWENLILQLAFEGGIKRSELEERASVALQQVGFDGGVHNLPSRLSIFQRKQVAIARLLLSSPSIVLCQSLFEGLSRGEQKSIATALLDYCRDGKTALLLTSNPDSLKGVASDLTFYTGGTLQT